MGFCGGDNDENDYEIGFKEGFCWGFALIGMFEAIRDLDLQRRACTVEMCRVPWSVNSNHFCAYWELRCPRL